MRNTEQTLNTAIGELRCINPDRPASLDELTALSAVRNCIDEMLRACVNELRTDPQTARDWPTIAYALGSSSVNATRQKYGSGIAPADEHVLNFWDTFAEDFVWGFLPMTFLYALYEQWMTVEFPDEEALLGKAFTRRLKKVATTSGEWAYVRTRTGSLMDEAEPLTQRVGRWALNEAGGGQYGLRRTATLIRHSSAVA
ncbi:MULTISPECIES: primase-like DNA-binding domain-containing protein [unclassified Cryobacterium]|uniref:primase-like DNA-binding domain-containing protein n=1 Tax=unclassified Cryobacterium TaxID=2649013 RepID=UPI000CE4AD84|nr:MULTISPECIES: primase-like DNA-binding domain-containing protein [unclassified Cryobacterium]